MSTSKKFPPKRAGVAEPECLGSQAQKVKAMQFDPVKKGVTFCVHAKANEMLMTAYTGQNVTLKDVDDLIYIAAADPDVEASMDPKGFAYWWVLNLKYQAFLARQKLGLAQPSEVM